MNNRVIQNSDINKNDFNISANDNFCHHCSNKFPNQQQLTCSNQACSKKYCIFCLANFYQKNMAFINSIQNNSLFNFWKCPSCEGRCLCNKCKFNFPPIEKDKEDQNKNNDFLGKKISSDAELIMWLSSGEDTSIDIQNVKFPFVPLNSKIKSKVFDKLIKIAKQCELFYRHKCKNDYIKKNCANCFEINFHQNDLLRFFNYETFLYYMKYLFLVQNKIVAYSKENFNQNKNDFEELFKRFKDKKEVWVFKDTKIICKQCMYFLINKPNFFENIKGIFLRQEKKFFLLNNQELNEPENNYNINFNNKEKIKNNNDINKERNLEAIIIPKNIFKITKTSKNEINKNNIDKNDFYKNKNNNIIINYNNQNNNIFNTLIFKDSFSLNDNPFFWNNNTFQKTFQNPCPLPYINNLYMNYNFNYLNDLQNINPDNLKNLFFEIKKEMTNIIRIVQLSKKDNDKTKYLSRIDLLNQKIINYFGLIEKSVIDNTNSLNNFLFKCDININREIFEISPNIIEFINENKKFLSLFNILKFDYLNIENNYITNLFQ